MKIDIQKVRKETPGCAHKNHLNSAGSSLPPKPVIDAIQNYLELESITGGYETRALKAGEIEGFYEVLAKLLNCQPRNIAHTVNATDAYFKALSSVLFERGDVLLTTKCDYSANQIAFMFLEKRFGVQFIRAEDTEAGGVDVDSMKELIDKYHPRLVSVTHVPTNSGLIQPVEEIGELCKEKGILYLVDACQSVGQMPVDIEKIHCDFLSVTSRKFLRGPRGAGFLYASDRVLEEKLEPVFPDIMGADWKSANHYELGNNAQRFEYWEKSYALMIGTKVAAEYAMNIGLENIHERVVDLADYTREKISGIEGVKMLDKGLKKAGITTFDNPNWDKIALQKYLLRKNINVSISPYNAGVIDFDNKGVKNGALRVSPHYFNTKEEIDELVEVLVPY